MWFPVPTPDEWAVVYVPLFLGLVFALVCELRTVRISNAHSAMLGIGLGGLRFIDGPLALQNYLVSVLVVAVVTFGVFWRTGWLGAGGAKLTIASAIALPYQLAWLFVGALVVVGLGLVALQRVIRGRGKAKAPGSLLVVLAWAATLAAPDLAAG